MTQFEEKLSKNMVHNPKPFYSYLNSKRKIKDTLSGMKDSRGNILGNAESIANELGTFFESTYISEPPGDVPTLTSELQDTVQIGDIIFTFDMVKDHLEKLNVSKSFGPDQIHPKLFKTLSNSSGFVTSLAQLFQKCYDESSLPHIWKTAEVIAIFKKGDKSQASNYRPISLTCVLAKTFEKIVRNHILEHVDHHITKQQHGFLLRKSCVSNLLECMDMVYGILESEECADILYLDFQKAFDTVPHKRLLAKLEAYGISGKTLRIIKDFLADRSFKVKVGSIFSKSFNVSSGVLQGSVIGPLLFLIYINDLPNGIRSFISLFADDVKMITKCSTADIAQADLDMLNEWERKWLLTFNTKDEKCKVLHIGPKNPNNDYVIGGSKLPTIETEKDLGLHMHSSLNWAIHMQKAINKANSVIGWIARNVISRMENVMLNVYKSLVRPHLEYAVQVWNVPAIHGNWKIIMELEDVQRKMTRMVDNIGLLTYNERLEALELTTLLERRARGDLIETFKIVTGKVNYGTAIFRTSRSGNKLLKDGKSNQFLPNRIANYWNKIPTYVKDAPSVDSFKARLQMYKSDYLKKGITTGHFWELSDMLLNKIDDSNRQSYQHFMSKNPTIAKIKNINISNY